MTAALLSGLALGAPIGVLATLIYQAIRRPVAPVETDEIHGDATWR